MFSYRVTYRNTRNEVVSYVVNADSETDVRSAFYMRYDGRLISIEKVG